MWTSSCNLPCAWAQCPLASPPLSACVFPICKVRKYDSPIAKLVSGLHQRGDVGEELCSLQKCDVLS